MYSEIVRRQRGRRYKRKILSYIDKNGEKVVMCIEIPLCGARWRIKGVECRCNEECYGGERFCYYHRMKYKMRKGEYKAGRKTPEWLKADGEFY